MDKVVRFVISSVEAVDQKRNTSVQQPAPSKSPDESVQLYCQQLVNVAKDLQLNEVTGVTL